MALAACLVLAGCAGLWGRGSSFLVGGIQVNEEDHDHWAASLEKAGMNTVSVTVYAHQGNWDSDHLWYDEENEAVLREIRAAKKQGLKVVLILRVALDHAYEANRFLWHGMIHPRTDEQLRSWFRQYRDFALRWSAVARDEGVDLLGVASELNELTSTRPLDAIPALHEYYLSPEKQTAEHQRILRHRAALEDQYLGTAGAPGYSSLEAFLEARSEAHESWAKIVAWAGEEDSVAPMNRRRILLEQEWRALIGEIRGIYEGRITYAANFDQYGDVGFWDALDVLGINAYFPVREGLETASASAEELEAGWSVVLGEIAAFRQEVGVESLPVVFTELGYTSRRGCTIEPWASLGFSVLGPRDGGETRLVVWQDQPESPEERALAIRSLRRAAQEVAPEMLQGLLYWKLSTQPGHRQIEPFVVILGDEPRDPVLAELRRL